MNLRRTCARLCHLAGGELDQIQFLLGHVSIQTTEHYLSCKQKLRFAVNDNRHRTMVAGTDYPSLPDQGIPIDARRVLSESPIMRDLNPQLDWAARWILLTLALTHVRSEAHLLGRRAETAVEAVSCRPSCASRVLARTPRR